MNVRMHTLARVIVTAAVAIFVGTLAACGGNGATTSPSIKFVTGASNVLTAAPGETLSVALNVTDASAFTRGIGIIGEGNLGVTVIRKQPPFDYSLALPKTLKPGTYHLTAIGYAGSEQPLATASAILKVDVPANALLSLAPPPATLVFEAIGEQLPIRVTGATASGSVDLSESPGLAYQLASNAVGSVDARGVVTAHAAGQDDVALLMNGQTVASVPVEVLKPALLPSATQIDFGNQSVGGLSGSQSVTVTNNFDYPIRILSVSTPPDYPETDNCVSGSALPAGQSCTINVSFQPSATGMESGAIRIVNSAVSVATQVFLSGTGT